MERLRHVARAGGGDPASIVAETVDAISRLGPEPSELVSLCRNLLDRHPACGPLWWLCAHLLSNPTSLDDPWVFVEQLFDDPTPSWLARSLPDDAAVMVVGYPRLAADALGRRPDVSVLAVDAGDSGRAFVRRLDRDGVIVDVVAPEAMLSAVRRADLVLVEAEACSAADVLASMGSGLAAVAAGHAETPVWLVAGRGRRLPGTYLTSIVARTTCRRDGDYEQFAPAMVAKVAGPEGVVAVSRDALGPECPAIPELAAPTRTTDG